MKLVKEINKTLKDSEKITEKEAEEAFVKIIKWIGEDPSREGLLSTPKRLVKAFREYYKGYSEDPEKILEKTFGEGKGDEILNARSFAVEDYHSEVLLFRPELSTPVSK